MPLQPPVMVRSFGAGFAVVLGLLAAWIIAAELIRSDMRFFPGNAAEAKTAAMKQSSAAVAAWIGWPRGELWTDYAVTANAALIGDMKDGKLAGASGLDNSARGVAETAATLAPSDARAWLLLAMNAWSESNDDKAAALLKMSYYTSPYSDDLFPLRIQIAARSPRTADEELNSYIEYELGVVVSHKPNLKRSIASAYRAASPTGRLFFDRSLAKLDPNYLAELKATKP